MHCASHNQGSSTTTTDRNRSSGTGDTPYSMKVAKASQLLLVMLPVRLGHIQGFRSCVSLPGEPPGCGWP